jgi:hypothetical protein
MKTWQTTLLTIVATALMLAHIPTSDVKNPWGYRSSVLTLFFVKLAASAPGSSENNKYWNDRRAAGKWPYPTVVKSQYLSSDPCAGIPDWTPCQDTRSQNFGLSKNSPDWRTY